jgi:hypothetical protein
VKVEHYYTTCLGTYRFDPKQFSKHMTEASRKRGDPALRDQRFKVAKAVRAWAAEQDKAVPL